MAGPGSVSIAARGSAPELAFAVRGAERVPYTAAPTLGLEVEITCPGGEAIRSILLDTQIQIAAARRPYDEATHARLFELFGPPEAWGRSLRTLLWTRVTRVVPPFTAQTVVTLEVPCSYDLEVAASRYFDALDGGAVPLELLFSGTVFYGGADGRLQTARISWEQEALFSLPVATWRATMDQHFPGTAWLRVGKEHFDRLAAYRSRHALATWDDALDALLAGED